MGRGFGRMAGGRTLAAARWMAVVVVCGLALPGTAAERTAAAGPNIVLILADDLGYGDVGCYGCPDTRTPAIDGLARKGVRFTSFYANAPECTPTRTALMTGRYPHRVGGLECAIGTGNVGRYDDAIRLAQQRQLGLPPASNTLVAGLKQAGYTVAGTGKWHLGYEPHFLPKEHGFDRYFGPLGGGVDYYFHVEWDGGGGLYEDGRGVRREGYLTDLITDAAVEFLKRSPPGRPFFLYVPFTAPHTPLQPPGSKPRQPRSEANWNEGTRETYVAMVQRLDQGIGRLLEALAERGLDDKTLVIFTSDNGGTKIGRNAPFSGTKGGLFEGGIRVPCIVRWPGRLKEGRTIEAPAITMDLTASLLRIAGADVAPESLDGIDVLAAVEQGRPFPLRSLFFRIRRGEQTWRAVRDGDWKFVSRFRGSHGEQHLFNLADDPAEQRSLVEQRPDELARLKAQLAVWEQEVRPQR